MSCGGIKAVFPPRATSAGITCSQPSAESPRTAASADTAPVADALVLVPPLAGGASLQDSEAPNFKPRQDDAAESPSPRRRWTLSHVRGKAGELPASPRLRHSSDTHQRSHGHLCICEICTCGMHKCHHKSHTSHFDGDTTSRSFHCAHPASPQASARTRSSERVQHPRQPFQGESTYKLDYNEKPLPERPIVPEARLDTAPFDATSSYREDFTEKKIQFEPQQPPAPPRSRQPFHDETSYKHFHSEKPLQPRPERQRSTPSRKNLESGMRRQRRFEGESLYARDFQAKPLPEPHQPAAAHHAPLPFEGESSYKSDYTKKSVPLDPRPAPQPRPKLPFDGETSYMHYHCAKTLPQGPSRPRSAPALPRGQARTFDGASTYRSHYVAPAAEAAAAASPRGQRHPASAPGSAPESRDFATTYGQHFVAKESPVCPIVLMPQCPHHAPEGREHSFWNEGDHQWC